MNRVSLFFAAPGVISVQEEELPELGQDQVLVQTVFSAISSGTELLIYRGEFPQDLAVDETITALSGEFRYPLKYGYSLVGRVAAIGSKVDPLWHGSSVFAFHPHESYFQARPDELILIPAEVSLEEALFLPNMETAVNFLQDGAPLIGEQVVVIGQGIVGLLTTSLLSQFPLASLATFDRYPWRRKVSFKLGAHACLDINESDIRAGIEILQGSHPFQGADLVYELSGNPAALDQAIALCGYNGRIVIGSWYGKKRASLDLGGRFHRSRMRLISSQVSSLNPELSGRWGKERRLNTAWEMIREIKPSRLITHRFPIQQADQAFRLLDQKPAEALQVILAY